MSSYEIVEVKGGKNLREFLKLPQKVNKDPKFVMPLNLHMKMMMGKINVPEKHFLIAKKDGETVARLGCKVHEHNKHRTLHFGFFECLEGHPEAAKLLIEKARQLYPDLKMMGPYHFRLEDPYVGVLVDGYQFDPYFLMPYNPPYYDQYLKDAGLTTSMDLYVYEATAANLPPASIAENAKAARAKGYTTRPINMKNLKEEAGHIARIFNDALSKNWGYEEFLDDQINEMVTLFKVFIDPRVVLILEGKKGPIGSLIMLPNYNPVIKAGKGRLTPSVIWNFIRSKGKLKTIRGYALGVLREYHGQGLASLIVDDAWKVGSEAGYEKCEISWILASNGPMNELSKHMGGKQSKTYRIYEAPSVSGSQH